MATPKPVPEVMSMRDYFAANALTGLAMRMDDARIEQVYHGLQLGGLEAIVAYRLADAMLDERGKE